MHQGDATCLLQALYVSLFFCCAISGFLAWGHHLWKHCVQLRLVSRHFYLNTSSCCQHGRSHIFSIPF